MSKVNDWLSANYPKEKFTPGFERILLAISHFELNFEDSNVITIAGTNGKGTVSQSLYQNIVLNNRDVSLFSSPHLFSILERFKFSNYDLTEDDLLIFFSQTHEELRSIDVELSFYEFTLIIFLRLSLELKSTYILLEVGVGGRLDATNIIDADVALVTSISRDHVDLLGNRYDKILFEKLGVIKNKTKGYVSFELDYLVDKAKTYSCSKNLNICVRKDNNDLSKRNKFLVSSALNHFGLDFFQSELKAVTKVNRWLYSCSHNLGAVRNLVTQFKYDPQRITGSLILLSYSHRDIKELEYMSKLFLELRPFVEDIYLTQINQFKAASLEDLKFISRKLNIAFMDEENLKDVLKQNKKIYLSGSNYFIGDFINKFK